MSAEAGFVMAMARIAAVEFKLNLHSEGIGEAISRLDADMIKNLTPDAPLRGYASPYELPTWIQVVLSEERDASSIYVRATRILVWERRQWIYGDYRHLVYAGSFLSFEAMSSDDGDLGAQLDSIIRRKTTRGNVRSAAIKLRKAIISTKGR